MKLARRAPEGGPPLAGLIHLMVVYVVWGSTYLAIRIAVREGSGFPPFTMAAMRVAVAGCVLLGWAALRGSSIRLKPGELALLAVTGVLLWVGGNGMVVWAEQRADSGYAALIVGSMPIWVTLMEAALDRRPPSALLAGSLVVGFTGLGLLTWPVIQAGSRADHLGVAALLLAPITWGAGSIVLRRRPLDLPPAVLSGYHQLFGALGLGICMMLTREPVPLPTAAAWGAWAYLVLAGSILAFTSFVSALRLLPISITMTYAYVNPVIAVFLGWIVLRESITPWTIAGTALVLIGVAGAFRDRFGHPRKNGVPQPTEPSEDGAGVLPPVRG
ncbi:MAG: EamA family transporter [Candidatus Eisenbacteria bacterium]